MENDMIVSFDLGICNDSLSDESDHEPDDRFDRNIGMDESNATSISNASRLARLKMKKLFRRKTSESDDRFSMDGSNTNVEHSNINMDDTLSSQSAKSFRNVARYFQQNHNPDVKDDKPCDTKSSDEVLQLSVSMQNVQMELMQMMQVLHNGIRVLQHDVTDIKPRFDMLEKLLSAIFLPFQDKIDATFQSKEEEEKIRLKYITSRFDKLEKLLATNAQNDSINSKLDRLESLINAKNNSKQLDKIEDMLSTSSNAVGPTPMPAYGRRRSTKRSSYTWSSRDSQTSFTSNWNLSHDKDKTIRKKRKAVIAEKVQYDYTIKKIPKSDEAWYTISYAVKSSVQFRACSEEEITDLIHAFNLVSFTSSSVISTQGESMNYFYVIDIGIIDLFVDGEHVSSLTSKGSFGEECFLGCASTATCRARENCKLWCIHRTDFRNITGHYRKKRLEVKTKFLRNVKFGSQILGNVLDDSDINALALATRSECYENGSQIIKEGDKGENFFIIESGQVNVVKSSHGQQPLVTLKKGNFFGEKALFSNDIRTASCVANEKVKCLILARDDFVRLFGDLQDLLDKSQKMVDETFKIENKNIIQGGINSLKEDKKLVDFTATPQSNLKLDYFDVKYDLGFGSFSTVKRVTLNKIYENENPFPDKETTFALKCSTKHKLKELNLMEHLRHERDILKEVSHPFIIKFYYEFEDADFVYFLLECVQGKEMYSILFDECGFSEDCSRFYGASVLLAFSDIHSKKIAYRDLKPENLMLDSSGFIKMVDFGFAKKIDKGKSFTFLGTPDYFAPEIICNEGHDMAVDYWSLGVLLFEMVDGVPPFSSDSELEMYQNIMSGRINFPPDFSPDLKNLISCLCNTDQSKRLGRIKGGSQTVMDHPWFSGVSWKVLLSKKAKAPFLLSKDGHYTKSLIFEGSDPYENTQPVTKKLSAGDGSNIEVNQAPKTTITPPINNEAVNRNALNIDKQLLQELKSIDEQMSTKSIINSENQNDENHEEQNTSAVKSTNSSELVNQPKLDEPNNSFEYSNTLNRTATKDDSRKSSYLLGRNRHEDKLKEFLSSQTSKGLPRAHLSRSALNTTDVIVAAKNARNETLIVNEDNLKKLSAKCAWKFALDNAAPPTPSSIKPTDARIENALSQDNVPVQKTAAIMNAWLSGIRNSSDKKSRVRSKAFEQFYLFSAELENLTLDSFDSFRSSRYLDPLYCKNVELVDCYPYPFIQSNNSLTPDEVSTFCFPFGANFRLIPRCAMERARNIGWVGKDANSYQIHTFTGANGDTKYGVSIKVREECNYPMHSILKMLRKKRQAAKIIYRFMRKCCCLNKHSSNFVKSRLFRKREGSAEGKGSKGLLNTKLSELTLDSSQRMGRRLSDPGVFGLKLKRFSDSLGRNYDSKHSFAGFEGNNSYDYGTLGTFEEVTDVSRARAKESYQIMQKNEESGEVSIMERCFIVIGTTLEELSLMFCMLENIIDFERRRKSTGVGKSFNSESKNPRLFASHAQSIARSVSLKNEVSVERHSILKAIQSKCCLSYEQIQIQYPISELDHVQRKEVYFEVDLAVKEFPKVSIPLPLPRIADEYGIASLLLRTDATSIITLTNLLLLERSLLVIGTSHHEVTSCTLALLALLTPFKWASAFMPLIPYDMLDFVSSPVPFVAGVVRRNELDLKVIEEDYRVQNAIADGMSVLNLTSGRVIVTKEKGMEDIVTKYPCPINCLDNLKNRLENLCDNKTSNLLSFKSFFSKGLSSQESVTIKSIRRVVFNHYKSLFDFVSKNAEDWENYGELDSSNNFEFFPNRLISPLRCRLKFQEIMVHTQLFQTFVEDRKICIKNQNVVPSAAFQIARWGQRIWRESYKRKNTNLLDTLAKGFALNRPNAPGQRRRRSSQSNKGLKSVISMNWKQPA